MRILVSGAGGLVGTALRASLADAGHTVVPLTRGPDGSDRTTWDPLSGRLDASALEGFDAVVHLAGEPLLGGRWTAERKRLIRDSRVLGTSLLCRTLAECTSKPQVFVSAAAVGVYGDRGDEVLTEDSPPGRGFLSDVCRAWESATEPAAEAGIRVVRARFGVVLAAHGGALAQMLKPFRLGLGGPLAGGRQYVSWIGLADAVAALRHCLAAPDLSGPVNLVAPTPVTNAELTRALATALRRPAFVPVPAAALRLVFGEAAVVLLASQRALPQRLLDSGYTFAEPEIEPCLRRLLAVG